MECSRTSLAVGTKNAQAQNEDFCALYKGNSISAIAIADGVGSSTDSHIAARLAVNQFLGNVKSFDDKKKEVKSEDVIKFWINITKKIKDERENNKEKYQGKANVLNTTLITLIELKDRYLISYLGNGSIWYIRGDFWHFWNRRWPWCMSDLMVGHTFLDENGRDVLYAVLGIDGDISNVKILNITKDNYCGEIFILTTDGISSQDHLKIGRDTNNKLWVEVNPHIESLVNIYLAEYLNIISKGEKDEDQILHEIIEKFLSERTFEDDATLGVTVPNKSKEYYLHKLKS